MALIVNGTGSAAPQGGVGELVKDSDLEHFTVDVIEASMKVPVIVDFWATWCGPCKTLGPLLEKVVRQAAGLVRMVKIDIDRNQDLAMQLRIQSVPTVYVFKDGKPVDGFVGAVPESQIRALIERVTGGAKPPLEANLEQAAAAAAAGDFAAAGALYAEVLREAPNNAKAIAGALRNAVAAGNLEGAREAVTSLPEALRLKPEVAAAISALELAEQGGGDTAKLRAKVEAEPDDHQSRLDLATALFSTGQSEAAIDHLLEQIRRDRTWNDEAGRKQLVKFFEALGHTHPLTVAARRRLSSILFS